MSDPAGERDVNDLSHRVGEFLISYPAGEVSVCLVLNCSPPHQPREIRNGCPLGTSVETRPRRLRARTRVSQAGSRPSWLTRRSPQVSKSEVEPFLIK